MEFHTSYQPRYTDFTLNSLRFCVLSLGQIEVKLQTKESVDISDKMRCNLTMDFSLFQIITTFYFCKCFSISGLSMLKLFIKSASSSSKNAGHSL